MKSRSTTAGLLVICLGICGNARCQQEPAAEGRPITPAGALLIDQTTHLPAGRPMPTAMRGSPHPSRRGGKDRYPPAAKRGSGVPSLEHTKETQQSICV